jgi:hypothetical protein
LGADEPVSFRPKQISCGYGLQVILGLQRLAGPEIILVIVLDLSERSDGHDAMVIGAKRCPCKRAGDL